VNNERSELTFQEIFALHPRPTDLDHKVVLRCIEECLDCAVSCTACADASVAEEDVVDLRKCIRLCLDCADVCDATGRVLTRQTEHVATTARAQVSACRELCRACAEECERHAQHHEHCRICAEECRRCEEACSAVLNAIS
jgi:Domain of Unknown Function (DUF326)